VAENDISRWVDEDAVSWMIQNYIAPSSDAKTCEVFVWLSPVHKAKICASVIHIWRGRGGSLAKYLGLGSCQNVFDM
jgi:hypothetical protein